MIYNSAGHPSGEAFIQMDSEQAAANAAQEMHNKYMELGKKRRWVGKGSEWGRERRKKGEKEERGGEAKGKREGGKFRSD